MPRSAASSPACRRRAWPPSAWATNASRLRACATSPRPTCALRQGSGFELLIDEVREAQQLLAVEIGRGERVADVAVDPVEHADVVLARVAERGLAVARGLGAHVEGQPAAVLRLVHELRDR